MNPQLKQHTISFVAAQALAAINEAVTTYRQLATARPDAFLPDLAKSLSNQSVRLSGLGQPMDALAAINEAVTTFRQLAAARPQIFTAPLVSSLRVLAAALASLGRDSEAARFEAEAAGLE